MALLDFLTNPPEFRNVPSLLTDGTGSLELKAAFDMTRVGIVGRPQYPNIDLNSLITAYKRNEMVFASIDIKATAAQDPRLIVQTRKGSGEWQEEVGHPLRRLIMRPNPDMDEAAFMRAYIVSLDVAGWFYAEKVRNKDTGLVEQLHPLNPAKIAPVAGERGTVSGYEYRDGAQKVFIPAEDMLVRRNWDIESRYRAVSPLAVCIGSVDADSAQTDYMRAFFNNAGVPSGILTVKGRKLKQEQADEIKMKWEAKYGRAWGKQHGLAILDEDATYQRIGSNLGELESEAIRSFTESRIAMVFRVPPLIIYSYTGLLRATYSNLKEAWRGFWDATLTPMFKDYRSWLTWNLLADFEGEDRIYSEAIRLAWDMSEVAALQDDVDAIQLRARENFKAGAITLNEMRALVGEQPDAQGDYYLRPFNVLAQPIGEVPDSGEPASQPVKLLPAPTLVETKARKLPGRATIERRIEREIGALLQKHYNEAASAVERVAA